VRNAIESSKVGLDLRYRLELVDDDLPRYDGRQALASTLRTQLGLETGALHGFRIRFAVEDVSVVGNDRMYNNAGAGSLANGVTDRPAVADPEITEVLGAALVYAPREGTTVQVGRVPLVYDDHRFIGTVAWRQHHQSVDAVTLDHTFSDTWQMHYAYLDRVHRIFGSRDDLDSHLINVSANLAPGSLSLFGYFLDYEAPQRAVLSTTTLGARFAGKHEFSSGGGALLYEVQFADQQDAADNPLSIDASYLKGELGYGRASWSLRAGFELLEGDGNVAFQTPLATLHKFNGWADKFLVTPAAGLEDVYLRYDQSHESLTWTVRYHQFRADQAPAFGSADYGSELDAELDLETSRGPHVALRVAQYDADTHSSDTLKLMLYTRWTLRWAK
jgi:hypothetical protein